MRSTLGKTDESSKEMALTIQDSDHGPSSSHMEEFTSRVSVWLKLDTEMNRLQEALRERRRLKRQLTDQILSFMTRYGIDDLDTLQCRLSCRVRQVREPLPRRLIQERLTGIYVNDPVTARTVTDAVFNRGRIERISLRRSLSRSG